MTDSAGLHAIALLAFAVCLSSACSEESSANDGMGGWGAGGAGGSGGGIGGSGGTLTCNAVASWLDLLPDSGAPVQPGASSLAFSATYTPGSDWPGLDESKVFHAALTHSDTPAASWTLRLGNGSQIYSLVTSLGELVPPQRPGDAEWVDEVIQSVMVNSALNDNGAEATKYQIHQAGCYLRDPNFHQTFYSPLFAEEYAASTRSFATLVWPQQAHIPSNYQSRLLLAQKVRDLGAGVIEVSLVYFNFGEQPIDRLSVPWLTLRNSKVPLQLVGLPGDAGESQSQKAWCDTCSMGSVGLDETSGWFAHLAAPEACVAQENCQWTGSERGIAVVFGTAPDAIYRWGKHTNAARDLTVSSLIRPATIAAGAAWFARYYMIVNELAAMRTLAPQYRGFVVSEPLALPRARTRSAALCPRDATNGQKVLGLACDAQVEPLARAYAAPVDHGLPLFQLRDAASQKLVLSTDPYELSLKPHDGATDYAGLLGFGVAGATPRCFGETLASELGLDPGYFPLTSATQKSVDLPTLAAPPCSCE